MSLGVFRCIVNGVQQRGDGGVLLVRGDECGYFFCSELKSLAKEQRDHMEELLRHDAAVRVFYVLRENEGKLDVLAYPREVVFRALAEDAATPLGVGPVEEIDGKCSGA
jgi:hypothetical protein